MHIDTFKGLNTLTHILFHFNQIEELPDDLLHELDNLSSIDFSNNK